MKKPFSIPLPIRLAYAAYNLYGIVSLVVGIVLAITLWAESHALALLAVVLSFPVGVATASGFMWLRGKALSGGPLPSPSARKRITPFTEFNVEWADGQMPGELEMRCPEHHTPLLFWPEPIIYDQHMGRPKPREPKDVDTPWKESYSRTAGALYCANDEEQIRFPISMSVGHAKKLIRTKLRGKTNREG